MESALYNPNIIMKYITFIAIILSNKHDQNLKYLLTYLSIKKNKFWSHCENNLWDEIVKYFAEQ